MKLDYVVVDKARYKDSLDMYHLWKELDQRIRTSATRGVNIPETITEAIACYAMRYRWNKGTGGDAIDTSGRIIEMKATSNWERDTSSFSPKEEFDELVFLRLDKRQDLLYIYETNINSDELKRIQVNSSETLEMQQNAGRRPRFSIIKLIIEPRGLEPVKVVSMRDGKITTL